jgi:predicted transposase/invertase (TIGR01784 family)
MDGLFIPTTDEPNQPFYLVEVQFQPDETLYYRIFGELFLYLKQYRLSHPWQVVVIYPSRTVERQEKIHFNEILALNRVRRIYLDELGSETNTSLGVEVVRLIIESEQTVGEKALALVEQAKLQRSR